MTSSSPPPPPPPSPWRCRGKVHAFLILVDQAKYRIKNGKGKLFPYLITPWRYSFMNYNTWHEMYVSDQLPTLVA
jgi:hypothetical protein